MCAGANRAKWARTKPFTGCTLVVPWLIDLRPRNRVQGRRSNRLQQQRVDGEEVKIGVWLTDVRMVRETGLGRFKV